MGQRRCAAPRSLCELQTAAWARRRKLALRMRVDTPGRVARGTMEQRHEKRQVAEILVMVLSPRHRRRYLGEVTPWRTARIRNPIAVKLRDAKAVCGADTIRAHHLIRSTGPWLPVRAMCESSRGNQLPATVE